MLRRASSTIFSAISPRRDSSPDAFLARPRADGSLLGQALSAAFDTDGLRKENGAFRFDALLSRRLSRRRSMRFLARSLGLNVLLAAVMVFPSFADDTKAGDKGKGKDKENAKGW